MIVCLDYEQEVNGREAPVLSLEEMPVCLDYEEVNDRGAAFGFWAKLLVHLDPEEDVRDRGALVQT